MKQQADIYIKKIIQNFLQKEDNTVIFITVYVL
jgi:hypothetical protein